MEEIISADLSSQHHVRAIMRLLDEYTHDDAGGIYLSEQIKSDLVAKLREQQGVHVVLATVEGEPAGMAICFEMPSFWPLKPKLCVYDLIVAQAYRGRGISQRMLAKAAEIAAQVGCCKLTVEVQEEVLRILDLSR